MDSDAPAISDNVLPTIKRGSPIATPISTQRYNSADASPVMARDAARQKAERDSRRRASEPPIPAQGQPTAVFQNDSPPVPLFVPESNAPPTATTSAPQEETTGPLPTTPPPATLGKPLNASVAAARATNGHANEETSEASATPPVVAPQPAGNTAATTTSSPLSARATTPTLPMIGGSRGRRSRMRLGDPLDAVDVHADEGQEMEALKRLLESQSARLEQRVAEVGTSTAPIPYGGTDKDKTAKKSKKKTKAATTTGEEVAPGSAAVTSASPPDRLTTPPLPPPHDPNKPIPTPNTLRTSQESELTELSMTGVQYGVPRKMHDYSAELKAAANTHGSAKNGDATAAAAAPAADTGAAAAGAAKPPTPSSDDEDPLFLSTTSSSPETSFSSLDDESTIKAKKAERLKAREARRANRDNAVPRQGRRNTATPSSIGVQSGARYFVLEQAPNIQFLAAVAGVHGGATPANNNDNGSDVDDDEPKAARGGDRRVSSSMSVLATTQRPDGDGIGEGGEPADHGDEEEKKKMKKANKSTAQNGPTPATNGVQARTDAVPITADQRLSIVSDPEIQALNEQMEQLQSRMARRTSELQRSWNDPQPSTGVIVPADPSVFAAVSEEEIQRKAMSAESFAKNQAQWRRNRLRASVEGYDQTDAPTATAGQKPHRKKLKKTGSSREPKTSAERKTTDRKRQTSFKVGPTPESDTPPQLCIIENSPPGGTDSLEVSGPQATRTSGEWNAAASGAVFAFASVIRDSDDDEDDDALHGKPRKPSGGSNSTGDESGSVESGRGYDRNDPRRLEAERDRLMQANDDDHPGRELDSSFALGRMSMAMSMASCSIARVTDGALAMMELLANRPDVIMPAPEETAMVRQGDVLSAKHVLKVDLQDALAGREGPTGIIASAPYFRIVPKLNVAGVAQANVSAIHTIIHEFRRAHVDGPIVWVNLREEPLVYINNAAHIVRERADPLKPIIIPNITGRGIEAIEYKLKQEILQEAASSGGNISTYVQTNSGLMEDQWEYVDPASLLTLAEVFRDIAKQYNPIESAFSRSKNALRVEYFRRPITQNVGPRPEDFDFVLDACLEEPKGIFVFNCQTGRGRTSAMMMIASIVRFYQWCVKDISVDVRVLRSTSNKLAFRTIQKLVSLFPDGKLHERRLNILMDMADKVYSMSDHISEAFLSTDAEHAEIAMMRLQQYAYLLVFSYFCEQRLWNYTTKLSFSDWLSENPSLKVLINSVRDKLDDQLRDERIGADDAGDDAEAARVIRRRHGNVLSAGRILCSMPMPTGGAVRQLRQLAPDTPIFTCGRMREQGRVELIDEVRSAFPKHRMVHWLSLRAEPMVLINDDSYTLAEYSSHLKGPESMTTMHVSLETIEQLEDRLRRDVLLESQENGGMILLHTMNEQGERTKQYVRVRSVRTSKSMMDVFAERTGVAYHRVPIPFSGQMLSTDVDPLLRYLSQTGQDPDDIVILADSEGSTRTTAALNILTIYRASRLGDLRSVQSPPEFVELLRASDANVVLPSACLAGTADIDASEIPDHPVELLLASTMCQMLTAGTLLQTVSAAIALGGKGKNWNILHMLDFLKRRIGKMGLNKPQCILDALHGLRCYLLVLLTALYLDDTGNYEDDYPFSKWVEDHTEVSHIIDTLPSRGEAALRYISTENLMKADLSRRHGDVLTANFCLKADHFPGCQKKGLRPVVCGAPNFRKVAFINVFGVAIPTRLGIHNILSLLGASNEPMRTYPGERNDDELFLGFAAPRLFDPTFKPEELAKPLRGSVVWVNLREEPILYVGDKPCVFRDLERPYVNVELTGIQTSKIEQVEAQLMNDVLNEAEQYEHKFLIHDEGNPGELVGRWEKATESTIKTVRNIYDELATKGSRVRFQRLPVTDEQSPDIEDFDALVNALLPRITEHLDRRETLSFVFNCQMGRGRTTTGMVICSLLIGLVTPEYYDELHNLYNPLYKDDESDLSKGEYQVITQLKRVLTNGRQAKYRVDLVLEACSRMQNLRTAIEAFAIQLGSPDLTEQGRAHAHHAGVHYLIRYFNIIVFSVYLEECYDRMRKRMRRTFQEWMASHPELTTLCGTAALN